MYKVHPFVEKDPDKIFSFMQAHPFALLVATGEIWPAVTQVPLLMRREGDAIFFRGHIMKHTDHHKALEQNPNGLFVFTGAHSYVSASWYTEPSVASTWNYETVQARTNIRFLDDAGLHEVLQETTDLFERREDSPAAFRNLSADYVQEHMKAIIAFEAEVVRLDATFKLSQNRDKESYTNIIAHLEKGDINSQEVAEAMKAVQPLSFKK